MNSLKQERLLSFEEAKTVFREIAKLFPPLKNLKGKHKFACC